MQKNQHKMRRDAYMVKVEFDCTFYEDNPQNHYWHYYDV
jgi:hypothetical protein